MGMHLSKPPAPQDREESMLSCYSKRRPSLKTMGSHNKSSSRRLVVGMSSCGAKSANLPMMREELDDDIVSKSTESTEGSPDFAAVSENTATVLSIGRSGSWLHYPSGTTTTQSQNRRKAPGHTCAANSRLSSDKNSDLPLPPADGDLVENRRGKGNSCSLPLKCPPRTRKKGIASKKKLPPDSFHIHQSSSFTDHDEENDHVQHLYDMRTWDMYLRITEARRRKQERQLVYGKTSALQEQQQPFNQATIVPSSSTLIPPSQIEPSGYGHFASTEEIEPIPIEVGGSLSGHVMIFGDLE